MYESYEEKIHDLEIQLAETQRVLNFIEGWCLLNTYNPEYSKAVQRISIFLKKKPAN